MMSVHCRKFGSLSFCAVFVCAALLVLSTPRETYGQQDENVFRLEHTSGTRVIDFAEFKGVSVTIRAHLDNSANVATAEILKEAMRAGEQSQWEAMRDAIATWSFSPNALAADAHSSIDYAIYIPSRLEGGNALIEIEARNLALMAGWTLPFEEQHLLIATENLDRENIIITENPPDITPRKGGIFKAITWNVWKHLSLPFQILFIILFVLLVWFVVMVIKVGLKPWCPVDRKQSGDEKELNDNLCSRAAMNIRKIWEQVIWNSQLPEIRELPFEMVQFDTMKKFHKEIAGISKGEEIHNKAKEYGLIDVFFRDEDFSCTDSATGTIKPQGLKEIRKTVDTRIEIVQNLVEVKNNSAHWMELDEEDKERCRQFAWEFFSRREINKALDIINEMKEKGAQYDLFDVFESGLNNHLINQNEWWASQEIDRAVDRSLALKVEERSRVLDRLWWIGSISPLTGLFGTVVGISLAFGKISGLKNVRMLMSRLAGDINIALSTTIVGLMIGILAFILYYFFKHRIERQSARVELYFIDITNLA